jgi:hypothetical protein
MAGQRVPITDNFGDLGSRKIEVCLCEECERLRCAGDAEFMRWLADHLRTLAPGDAFVITGASKPKP